jgi:hypothetical protein
MMTAEQQAQQARYEADEAAVDALKNNKFSVEIVLDERTLHDNLVSAIEGGVRYWARVDVGAHKPGWLNYFTAKFTIHEISDEKHGAIQGQTYELTMDKLKQGLRVLQEKYSFHFMDIVRATGDATTGDVLVQCALFGTIVYG